MQPHYPRSCGPEQLHKLQIIFDDVCRGLTSNGTFNGSNAPETPHGKMARRVVHYEISRQVMSYADHCQLTESEITHAIVKGMTFAYGLESGLTKPFRIDASIPSGTDGWPVGF